MSVINHLRTLGVYLSGPLDNRMGINGPFRFFNTVTSIATVGAGTLTAAQILKGLILRDPAGASRTDTTPTATQIVNALGIGVTVGSAFDLIYRNTGSISEIITFAGGTDVTLVPTAITLDAGESVTLRFIVTNAATPAVSVYNLGVINTSGADLAELVTDDRTLTAADHGKTFFIATDAKVFNLPATVLGLKYTFVNTGADGNNIMTINPVTADAIIGCVAASHGANADATTANGLVSQSSAAANKDFVNTKTTANQGDRLTIIGDGVDGWVIVEGVGVWASEG